jgi:hypothetical protein
MKTALFRELNAIEDEICAIYWRSCARRGDRARLYELRELQAKLTARRRCERALAPLASATERVADSAILWPTQSYGDKR